MAGVLALPAVPFACPSKIREMLDESHPAHTAGYPQTPTAPQWKHFDCLTKNCTLQRQPFLLNLPEKKKILSEPVTLPWQQFVPSVPEKESVRTVLVTLHVTDKECIAEVEEEGCIHTFAFDTRLAGKIRCIEYREDGVYVESARGSAHMNIADVQRVITKLLDGRDAKEISVSARVETVFGNSDGPFSIPFNYQPPLTVAKAN